MSNQDNREVWQRGPVEGVPPLSQPVAHALLQVVEELEKYIHEFPPQLLWERPAGIASVGFHLLHIQGVIDRLFTYARGENLSPSQMKALAAETEGHEGAISARELLDRLRTQVGQAIEQLRRTPDSMLTEGRALGRKQIPTTVQGLLFHAAEHSQRHLGQLLVTTRILRAERAVQSKGPMG